MPKANDVFARLQIEANQLPPIRTDLYKRLEKELGGNKRVVSFFTSFRFPVIIDDSDADMLEETLSGTDLNKDLVLLLNSPGGDALAAERIVNICRTFSKNGFSVIVPKMAKSAATMVCLGADKIIMSKTSELGPIDPQIVIYENGEPTRSQAAHEILESYNDLMNKASAAKGRIEPYLQQLARFDARDIRRIKSAQDLSEKLAVSLLKSGTLKHLTIVEIKKKIKPLIDPKSTGDHGRPLFCYDVKKCGLNIEEVDNGSAMWRIVWELYVRINHVTLTSTPKVIESLDKSYVSVLSQ